MAPSETELSSHERSQLTQILPELLDLYDRRVSVATGEDEEAYQEQFDELMDVHDTVVAGESVEGEQWDVLVEALDETYEAKYQWIRAKLARRTEMEPEQQGFTTRVPVGAMMTTHRAISPINELHRLPDWVEAQRDG